MKAIKFLVIVILVLISNQIVIAEDEVGIKELIKIALKENHYVKAKKYSLRFAESDLQSSKSNFYPKLILEEKFTTGDQTSYSVFTKLNQERLSSANFLNPGTATNFQTTFTLEMPLYVKELYLIEDSKRLSLMSATKGLEGFQEEIAFQVFKAYLNYLKSNAFNEIAEKSLEEAKEVYRIAKVRAESGTGLKSDELRAFVFLKDREAMLIKTKNDVSISKKSIELLVGGESNLNLKKEMDISLNLPPLTEALANLYENRRDFVSKRFDVENSQKYYEMQKARFYPKVFLSGSYYNDGRNVPLGSDGTGYVIGVAMRWELFDKTRADDEAKSKYQVLMAKEALNQFQKELKFNLETSYLRVEEARKKVEVAKEAVKEGEETFRLIKLRYNNNLSTMVELLDAELSLINARNNLIIAENEYYEALGKALYEAGLFLKSFSE